VQDESTSSHSDDRDYESSPKGGEQFEERAKASSPRQACTRDNQARYKKSHYSNVPFDYKEIGNDQQSLWHRKPCTFCGMNNHVVSKCWKRMALYRKVMETRKKPRHEDPSPHGKKNKGMKTWIKKNHCTHCNKGGHQEATCWTLHPELCPKKDKGSQLQEEGQLLENKQHRKEDIFILMTERMNKIFELVDRGHLF
jgi:hypothetical protein